MPRKGGVGGTSEQRSMGENVQGVPECSTEIIKSLLPNCALGPRTTCLFPAAILYLSRNSIIGRYGMYLGLTLTLLAKPWACYLASPNPFPQL